MGWFEIGRLTGTDCISHDLQLPGFKTRNLEVIMLHFDQLIKDVQAPDVILTGFMVLDIINIVGTQVIYGILFT